MQKQWNRNLWAGLILLAISSAAQAANIPQWWYTRGLVNTNLTANDYAPANVGQLKQVAYQTWREVTGNLSVSNLTSAGTVTVGNNTSTNPVAGTIRWTGGDFEGYTGSGWVSLTWGRSSPITGMVLVQGGTLPDIGNGVMTVASFYMGQYEVTWGEWQTVRTWAAANGYDIGSADAGCADNHPVHGVSWYAVVKWCNARSEKEGRTPVYTVSGGVYKTGQDDAVTINANANGYRLPTDAEWEYAARGGTQSHGYTYSGGNDLNAVGWYWENSSGAACDLLYSGHGTWPVGQKVANDLGIYDMSGNVWEWCFDWYPGYEGSYRVVRGGGWNGGANGCQVGYRGYDGPGNRSFGFGFRLAVSVGL